MKTPTKQKLIDALISSQKVLRWELKDNLFNTAFIALVFVIWLAESVYLRKHWTYTAIFSVAIGLGIYTFYKKFKWYKEIKSFLKLIK